MKTEKSDKEKEKNTSKPILSATVCVRIVLLLLCIFFWTLSLEATTFPMARGVCVIWQVCYMRRECYSLSVRCNHVCCWFYCISQNVSTIHTILAFPLRLQECSSPILSYLFFSTASSSSSLVVLVYFLLHFNLLFYFALSMCYYFFSWKEIRVTYMNMMRNMMLWILLFFFHRHDSTFFIFIFFFIFRFLLFFLLSFHSFFFAHIYLIYLCISVDAMVSVQLSYMWIRVHIFNNV